MEWARWVFSAYRHLVDCSGLTVVGAILATAADVTSSDTGSQHIQRIHCFTWIIDWHCQQLAAVWAVDFRGA